MWLRWTMAPWFVGGNEIGGAILFSEVITDQVEARRALKESDARYRALFDSINAGFCVVEVSLDNADGRIDYRVVEANPAFYDRTGFPEAILGQWLRTAVPELEEHWYDIYGGVARTGEPVRFEEHSEALGRWFDVFAFRIDEPEDHRVAILFHDISDRKRHEEHVSLLLKEVNHRSKNMLSLVTVIAKRTAAQSGDDFIKRFSERLAALAANQDLLVGSHWDTVDLEDLIRAQLAHFGDLFDERIFIAGPKLAVIPEAAEKLGMAFHELATNAGKYGALSNETGCIRIAWQTETEGENIRLVIDWHEDGGPPVKAPAKTGFGSLVSGSLLESSLDGKVSADYHAEGLRWSLRCPLGMVTDLGAASGMTNGASGPGGVQSGVLVVDDDPLLALSIADFLKEAGLAVIGPAYGVDRALALIEEARPDIAVLDVNLGKETSERVAIELRRIGVPFICVSGYSSEQLPEAFAGAPFLVKPVDEESLLSAVRQHAVSGQA